MSDMFPPKNSSVEELSSPRELTTTDPEILPSNLSNCAGVSSTSSPSLILKLIPNGSSEKSVPNCSKIASISSAVPETVISSTLNLEIKSSIESLSSRSTISEIISQSSVIIESSSVDAKVVT